MSVFEMNSSSFPELEGVHQTEVCIIGGGMAGLNLAFLLKQAKREVIVLEAEAIGHAQSVRTTAKITCLPGFFYHDLIERVGLSEAHKAARILRRALAEYADLIFHHQINCDFERLPFVLLSSDAKRIEKEAKALKELHFMCEVDLQKETPLGKGAAVILDNQAQFDAGAWMSEISKGLEIYEHSRAVHVENDEVFTAKGKVQAKHIVFCDHYPFVNFPGAYFMKMHQERSHVLTLKNVPRVNMMVYRADEIVESLRFDGQTALYSGFSHPTGKGSEDVLKRMKEKAKSRFETAEIIAVNSAQDCMTPDSMPYIGQFSSSTPHWHIATGFNKWGMIYSMAAALILRDKICGIPNPDASVFDSLRSVLSAPVNEMKHMASSFAGLFREFMTLPELKAEEIPLGEGGIVELDGISLGVYKETDGTLFVVSSRCPHLKCQLMWNSAEKTWDCPCHGSRFDRYGHRIEGPAESLEILQRIERKTD